MTAIADAEAGTLPVAIELPFVGHLASRRLASKNYTGGSSQRVDPAL
jgi:hypothetical protein